MKPKLLCILHRSPPIHGAAKVGDFVASSNKLVESFHCKFITIKSSETIEDIGRISIKKIYYILELFFRVAWVLIIFRPQKIYFTASVRGVAFFRDLMISLVWKVYGLFKKTEVYYHYHTKGVSSFVSHSAVNLMLTRFFLRRVNLILLSPVLLDDFDKVATFNRACYLPNGVENPSTESECNTYLSCKFHREKQLEVLYLSNMIKEKGYFNLLELANETKAQPIHYHFAGGWNSTEDEKEFFSYIETHQLTCSVTFYGFVSGEEKRRLFEKAHVFAFPTRYKNEAFPLSILEALSYGVPVLATDEASIPYIIDQKSGVVIDRVSKLKVALEQVEKNLVNMGSAIYCRQRYLDHFSLDQFEVNLVRIFKGL